MFRLFLTFTFALLACPALAQDYEALTTSNTVIRQAPGPNFAQVGTIPAGTPVSVTVCFDKGTYCLINWSGEPASGFVAGELLTIGQGGQTVLSAEQAKWQKIADTPSALPEFKTIPRAEIRTEGDSYMAGAYGTRLNQLIARATGRPVRNTAVGASELSAARDRILSPANKSLLPDLTIIWDGSNNGMTSVAAYADQLGEAIKALGHDHFIIIPPMHPGGGSIEPVAAELEKRWPDNVLDWRDVLGPYEGQIPEKYLAEPAEDKVHLNDAAMGPIAEALAKMIAAKGW